MALKEVCIVARNKGRAQAGDIIDIRDPIGGIGLKEGKDYLWILLDESVIPKLSELRDSLQRYRFQVPLAAIKNRFPQVDLARLDDPNDWYQPFLDSNPVTGMHRATNASVDIRAALVDKEGRS